MAEDDGSTKSAARIAEACSRTGNGSRGPKVTLKTRGTPRQSGSIGFGGSPWKTKRALVRGQARGHDVAHVFVQDIPLIEGILGSINRLEKFDDDLARVNDQ